MSDIEGGPVDAEGWSPPCGTFSMVREVQSEEVNRPRPLRGEFYPDLLGFKHLTYDEKKQVQLCLGILQHSYKHAE